MIRVVAIITAKPGCREELLTAFWGVVPAVRAEQGCIEYEPVMDTQVFAARQAKIGADAFMVLETWESAAALKAHAFAPHMAAYSAKVKDLMASLTVYCLAPA